MRRGSVLVLCSLIAAGCADGTRRVEPGTPSTDAGDATGAPDADTPDADTPDADTPDAEAPDVATGSPPQAQLTADPTSGEIPLTVRFDGSGSADPDGDLTQLRWSFGDGETAEGAAVEHTYLRPGNFTATLTVVDAAGQSAQAEVTISAGLPPCPTFAAGLSAGIIDSPILDEVSGLVASRTDADLFWLNNDSGDGPRIYAVNAQGAIRAGYELTGAQAVDWEDIALGPGPRAGETYLYVGDIGDNDLQSPVAPVYRIVEPTNVPTASAMPSLFRVRSVETIALSYGGNRAFNAETMMVDPLNGDLYVVTKSDTGRSRVFRAPAPLVGGSRVEMEEIAELAVQGEATGGDMSLSGEIVIRTYERAFLWRRPSGMSVADALRQPPCAVRLAPEPQGEAISFGGDGRDLWTTSEGQGQRLLRYRRR